VGPIGRSHLNIYRQILAGARAARTAFVACCEDDALYTPGHFTAYRPAPDAFAYNLNRWGLYTWTDPPVFNFKRRRVVNQLIAPRLLLIEALEERFAKFPDASAIPVKYWADPGRREAQLGVTVRETVTFRSPEPNIVFSHPEAFGYLELGRKKRMGLERCDALAPWGKAAEVLADYWGAA
jgi:hypothetical protein